eukprot:6234192-Amphidinium_carterae.1
MLSRGPEPKPSMGVSKADAPEATGMAIKEKYPKTIPATLEKSPPRQAGLLPCHAATGVCDSQQITSMSSSATCKILRGRALERPSQQKRRKFISFPRFLSYTLFWAQ